MVLKAQYSTEVTHLVLTPLTHLDLISQNTPFGLAALSRRTEAEQGSFAGHELLAAVSLHSAGPLFRAGLGGFVRSVQEPAEAFRGTGVLPGDA